MSTKKTLEETIAAKLAAFLGEMDKGVGAYLLRNGTTHFSYYIPRKDRGYEPDQQRENWTTNPSQAQQYASTEEAAAATSKMRYGYSIVNADDPTGDPVGRAVNGNLTSVTENQNSGRLGQKGCYRCGGTKFIGYGADDSLRPCPKCQPDSQQNNKDLNEDWGSSDWTAAIDMMDRELEDMDGINPENIEAAAQSVAEHYYDMMGYDDPQEAEDSIISMYLRRKGLNEMFGSNRKKKPKSQREIWFDLAVLYEIGNEEWQDSEFPQPDDFIDWAIESGYEINQDRTTITKDGNAVDWRDFEAAIVAELFGGRQSNLDEDRNRELNNIDSVSKEAEELRRLAGL